MLQQEYQNVNFLYRDLLKELKFNGEFAGSRAGEVKRKSNLNFSLRVYDQAPIITLKKVNVRAAVGEFCWFLRGDRDTDWLVKQDIKHWQPWAEQCETIGNAYSVPFASQLEALLNHWYYTSYKEQGKLNYRRVENRRNIINLCPKTLHDYLPCCFPYMQFVCEGQTGMSLHITMRSSDVFLGLPFDLIVWYCILNFVASAGGKMPQYLYVTLNDAHFYMQNQSAVDTALNNAFQLDAGNKQFPNIRPPKAAFKQYDPMESPSVNMLKWVETFERGVDVENNDYGIVKFTQYNSLGPIHCKPAV